MILTKNIYSTLHFFICIILVSSNCTFTHKHIDRKSDLANATHFTDSFYTLVKTGKYEETYHLYSKKISVPSPKQLGDSYNRLTAQLGPTTETELVYKNSTVLENSNIVGEYNLTYHVKRGENWSVDTFKLLSENGVFGIVYYNITPKQ